MSLRFVVIKIVLLSIWEKHQLMVRILNTIRDEVQAMLNRSPNLFTFGNLDDGMISVKDFGTTGVVAFAEGKPFSQLETGNHNLEGRITRINAAMLYTLYRNN